MHTSDRPLPYNYHFAVESSGRVMTLEELTSGRRIEAASTYSLSVLWKPFICVWASFKIEASIGVEAKETM